MKRGQLSILLIVSIMVVLIVAYMIYIVSKATPGKVIDVNLGVANATFCLEEASKAAI